MIPCKIPRTETELRETESRLVVFRAGGRKNEELWLNGDGLRLG